MTHTIRCLAAVLWIIALASIPAPAQIKPAKEVLPQKLVTLEAQSVTAAEALKLVAEQTGVEVKDLRTPPPAQKMKLAALQKVAFWQAMDGIADATGARLSLYQPNGVVALVDGKPLLVPPSYDSIFRTTVQRLSVEKDFTTGNQQCRVWLELAWEPWFKPFLVEVKSYQTEYAPNAKGTPLEVKGKVGWNNPANDILKHALEIDWRMEAPDRTCPAIATLKGEFYIIGPEKMLTVTFDNLEKLPTKQVVQDIAVSLKSLDKSAAQWHAIIDLSYPAGGPELDSFQSQSWLMHNKIALQNRKNPALLLEAEPLKKILRFNAREATIGYTFKEQPGKAKLGKLADWKLVYETPGRIVEVSVPFAFKNVPLP